MTPPFKVGAPSVTLSCCAIVVGGVIVVQLTSLEPFSDAAPEPPRMLVYEPRSPPPPAEHAVMMKRRAKLERKALFIDTTMLPL
jgi:hypothetical protein